MLHQMVLPSVVPAAMVRGLYDGYAARFDDHLVQQLTYRTPNLLCDQLRVLFHDDEKGATNASPRAQIQGRRPFLGHPPRLLGHTSLWDRCLDLGCGTGLSGRALRPLVRFLEGVDLSAEMIHSDPWHRQN